MDMISYLPQSILHDILSRLSDKDAARTSVLSKAWHDTWSTFPFLVFDESRYPMTQIPNDADIQLRIASLFLDKYKFCKSVLDTLIKFRCKGLAIRKFKLVFKSITPPTVLSLVNDWMDLACDSGVEVLQLDNGVEVLQHEDPISSDSYEEFACLPLCVLEAKSLIELKLSWDFRVDQAFLNHPIKFSSLQVLSLDHVYLGDGQAIQNIISSCPLIEKLELVRCFGLKYASICGLPKLKVVYIVGIEEVDADSPSLENLSYFASSIKTVTPFPCKINMDKCTNLRELSLVCVGFDPFALQEYPLASPSFKHLTLYAISDLEEWCLDLVSSLFWSFRPSIVSFNWDSNKTFIVSFNWDSNKTLEKIFCEKLINRKEDDRCRSSTQIKCWWRFLKDVKVSSTFRNHNIADDLKTLLESFPTLSSEEEEEVSRFKEGNVKFWLEWQL